jgi:putative (di)nucleoside polyphosphate hydrolase
MLSNYVSLPYGFGVGVVLINSAGLIGVGRGAAGCAWVDTAESWQMPQAPLASGEPARDVALRLLHDDAGFERVTMLAEAPGWFTFELPPRLIGVALEGRYLGQKLKWVVAKLASVPDLPCARQHPAAFTSWRWVTAGEVVALAPPLKREVYGDVLSTFAPLLDAASEPQRLDARVSAMPWFVQVPR